MIEINKPNKRTFWKITSADGSVVHQGYTEINQVTVSGQDIVTSSENPEDVYPALPESGTLEEGDVYSYDGKMYRVRQAHERTIYHPDETPDLFYSVRANTDGSDWIQGEAVEIGDVRTHDGVDYQCLQSHTTEYEPDTVPALWKVVTSGVSEWVQPQGAHDAYNTGDRVLYNGDTWESTVDANVWQPGVYGWVVVN